MTPSSEGKGGLSKRSCTRCSQKKLRCDRKNPCGRCVKTGDECVHLKDKRAPRKLNRPPISEILVHLKQLEEELERLKSAAAKQPLGADGQLIGSHDLRTEVNSLSNAQRVDTYSGRLVTRGGRSRYVGDEASVVLGDKIRELQEICEKTSSAEESVTSSANSNIASFPVPEVRVFGSDHSTIASRYHGQYPQPLQIRALWNFYMTNVAPLIAFLYMPSIDSMIDKLCANPDSNIDPAKESLIWAVCFSAVISMTPQQCLSTLNEDRDTCIRDYRIAVEQALAKANLISSQDIRTLQAAVLFLLCLRRCGDSRIVWIETSIVVRVAQCQGVHRDGERLGLSPFETEIRRRLWWHICILDMLCSEDQGTDTHIRPEMFDAKIPSNIDISELNPQLTALPPPQQGFTEITLCIIQCEMMSELYWVVNSLNQDTRQLSMLERGKLLSGLGDRLETQYLRNFDLNIPIQWLTAVIARLTLSKAWLVHSLNASASDTTLSTKNDEIFHMGVEILQFATLMQTNEMTKQWSWLCKSYKQRHVAAFILSELSARPITTETEHAWELVTGLYSQWVQEDPPTNAMLQNPLSRLMKRAALSREKKLGKDEAESSSRYSNSAQLLDPGVEEIKEPNIPRSTDLLSYGFVHSDMEMDLGNANVVPSEVSMPEVDATYSSDLYEFPISSLDWLTGPLF